jgi:hypothetical protein
MCGYGQEEKEKRYRVFGIREKGFIEEIALIGETRLKKTL